jgi:hypothetical protein
MEIEYQDYILEMEGEEGSHELYFRLFYINPINNLKTEVWNGLLMGLWEDDSIRETEDLRRCWEIYNEGDYFQQTITRLEKGVLPHISFTAVFQEIIRNNRDRFGLIENLYSTSNLKWLSMDFGISVDAIKFWGIQVENGFAEWIENESRYKANLE